MTSGPLHCRFLFKKLAAKCILKDKDVLAKIQERLILWKRFGNLMSPNWLKETDSLVVIFLASRQPEPSIYRIWSKWDKKTFSLHAEVFKNYMILWFTRWNRTYRFQRRISVRWCHVNVFLRIDNSSFSYKTSRYFWSRRIQKIFCW